MNSEFNEELNGKGKYAEKEKLREQNEWEVTFTA